MNGATGRSYFADVIYRSDRDGNLIIIPLKSQYKWIFLINKTKVRVFNEKKCIQRFRKLTVIIFK